PARWTRSSACARRTRSFARSSLLTPRRFLRICGDFQMSQYYTVTWVGNKTREWSSQYGQFIDYQIAVAEYDPTEHGGSRRTVTLTQKAGTPAPQVGQKIFGGIVVETVTPRQGDPFEV